jgi:hypothetical protein
MTLKSTVHIILEGLLAILKTSKMTLLSILRECCSLRVKKSMVNIPQVGLRRYLGLIQRKIMFRCKVSRQPWLMRYRLDSQQGSELKMNKWILLSNSKRENIESSMVQTLSEIFTKKKKVSISVKKVKISPKKLTLPQGNGTKRKE